MTPKPAIESDQKSTRWQDQSPWKEHFERIEAQANEPIERDPKAEEAIWETHIAPIIKKHSLKRRNGKLFEYRHFEKNLTMADVDAMVRKTSHLCMSIKFPKAGVSAEEMDDPCGGAINFSEEVVRYLRDCKAGGQRFELKAGGEVDLCIVFRDFLYDVFENKTLPEFLVMLAGDGFHGVALFSDKNKSLPPQEQSRVAQKIADARWGPHHEKMNQAVEAARVLWESGDQRLHNKMADHLLALPEFESLKTTRSALLKALVPAAEEFGRVRGKSK